MEAEPGREVSLTGQQEVGPGSGEDRMSTWIQESRMAPSQHHSDIFNYLSEQQSPDPDNPDLMEPFVGAGLYLAA